MNKIKEIVTETFKKLGYDIEATIIKSNRLDLCDYQCDDLFKVAKNYHENPIVIGEKVVECINNIDNFNDYFSEVTFAKPGFINIKLSDKLINNILNKINNSEDFNIDKNSRDVYFLDYGGPNVAKPLHVGHLRTAIIGESIKRIINFKGCKTISDVHLGDYGLQIGEVIYDILDKNMSIDDITLEYLDEAYPRMSKMCKEDETILNKCALITKELQEGNVEYTKLWKKILE